MIRGTLTARPNPEVHLDWRVLFIPPESKPMALLWRVFSSLRAFFVMTLLLSPRTHMNRWLQVRCTQVTFEVVVIGNWALRIAVELAVKRHKMWVRGVRHYPSWDAYAADNRAYPGLAELIIPNGYTIPLLQGIPFAIYRGWGHEVGR